MKKLKRRATRHRDQGQGLVAEWKASGQTAAEFARTRDVSQASLFYWSSMFRRELSARAPARLLPVRVTASLDERAPELELTLGLMRLRFDERASPRYVATVARALLDVASA
jgi:hypothetical protein